MPGQPKKSKKYGIGRSDSREELFLPSGNTCLVIRPGIQGLIKAGLVDSLDSLTTLVQQKHIDAHDPKAMAQATKELSVDPKRLMEGLEIIDRVVCHVVKAPEVFMSPYSEEERDPSLVYIDDVDDEDKMFIFQFVVGGTRDIESFRKQSQELVGSVSAVQDVPLPAE